ncbi:hypothetical protein ElyMa_004517200 [Elysia marginata]|uniref:Uncharacterized protein n=1 Tax=Elysia marginata TaxID=1093978 RepID=A0AAV4HLH5_9GAST|nr:hypothetical protein ElyMa_004517200 [Elysia marginata]
MSKEERMLASRGEGRKARSRRRIEQLRKAVQEELWLMASREKKRENLMDQINNIARDKAGKEKKSHPVHTAVPVAEEVQWGGLERLESDREEATRKRRIGHLAQINVNMPTIKLKVRRRRKKF